MGAVPIVGVHPRKYSLDADGCDVAPTCLNCPLPRCKYDERPGRVYQMWIAVNVQGQPLAVVARQFGVTKMAVSKASHQPAERFAE